MSIQTSVRSEQVVLNITRVLEHFSRPQLANMNRKVAISLHRWVLENFKAEGKLAQPGGWQELALSTILRRARRVRGVGKRKLIRGIYRSTSKKGQSTGVGRINAMAALQQNSVKEGAGLPGRFPILQDTGALRASFRPFSDGWEAGVGAGVYSSRGAEDAPWDLAAIHQEGRGRVPARPMLPTAEQAKQIGLRVYNAELARVVSRANV